MNPRPSVFTTAELKRVGTRGRWRCLTLLGTVYGLVLLLQVGVFYLLPAMMIAGMVGSAIGRGLDLFHRTSALLLAAAVYEVLAGRGAPIKIHFGTSGRNEPLVWALWLAELPLRFFGAATGVWLTRHFRMTVPSSGALGEKGRDRLNTFVQSPFSNPLSTHGLWSGPVSLLRRPVLIFRRLLWPQLMNWATKLSE